jgi:hypothetical protein
VNANRFFVVQVELRDYGCAGERRWLRPDIPARKASSKFFYFEVPCANPEAVARVPDAAIAAGGVRFSAGGCWEYDGDWGVWIYKVTEHLGLWGGTQPEEYKIDYVKRGWAIGEYRATAHYPYRSEST